MKSAVKRYPIIAFTLRFIALHTLTYLVFGVLFMLVSGYFEYFIRDPIFDLVMKPADALTVRIAPLVQVMRGAFGARGLSVQEVLKSEKAGLNFSYYCSSSQVSARYRSGLD